MRALRHLAGIALILVCLAIWLGLNALNGGSEEIAREFSAFVILVVILACLGVAADERGSYRRDEDRL